MGGLLIGLLCCCILGPASAGAVSDLPEQKESDAWRFELEGHQRLLTRVAESGGVPAPFTTDGCSGGLSAGWHYLVRMIPGAEAIHGGLPPWEYCCVAHDRLYHAGGAWQVTALDSYQVRKDADQALRSCIMATGTRRTELLGREYGLSQGQVISLYETIAAIMYRAVRIGGVPCSGLPWRWGYGWPPCD